MGNNAEELPDSCVSVKESPNMSAINEAYESSGELPNGVTISNGGQSITIRRK